MANGYKRDLLHRYEGNPVLTVNDVPYRCNTVFNGSPVKFKNEYIILLRIEGLQGYSFFSIARSNNGLNFIVDPEPVMLPMTDGEYEPWESHGLEDPRITEIDGVYYIFYTTCGNWGHHIAIAETTDFVNFRRMGIVSEPGNKDGVLFPRKVNGLYARLDRPIGGGVGSIWISYSPDLINWGRSEYIMAPRPRLWDNFRIGASAPPIETPRGWLEIYHGVKMTSAGPIYRTGAAMLDLENPAKVLGRSIQPLQGPREHYERIGDIGNVVFACGAIVEDDNTVKVYYGAADTSICVSTAMLNEIIDSCFEYVVC